MYNIILLLCDGLRDIMQDHSIHPLKKFGLQFQVDQGLGIGSKLPFFNRHQLTVTKFIQLQPEDKLDPEKPPLVGVVHGRYGGCVGDLASYDAFTLGGPYSVRGYNMGELGAARNFLEVKS